MFGAYNRPGVTFIEIIVVMTLMALLASVAIPYFGKRKPMQERRVFVSKVNALLDEVLMLALTTEKVHKINFNFKNRIITAGQDTGHTDRTNKPVFGPVVLTESSEISWPATFEIKHFFVQGIDGCNVAGRTTDDVWFFILPDGQSQDMTMQFIDTATADHDSEGVPVSIVLNPFTVQCKAYEAEQEITF